MIDIDTEELLTFAEAAGRLPSRASGKHLHKATVHRWAMPGGLEGARLESIKIGGIRYTTPAALQRFVEACSARE